MDESRISPLLTFRACIPIADEAAAQRVAAKVKALNAPSRAKRRVRRRPMALVVCAAAIFAAGTAAAVRFLGPTPGMTGGFSALQQLPPAPWPTSMSRAGLEQAAAAVGVSTKAFLSQFRLLQSGLSLGLSDAQAEGALYAYVSTDGRQACLFLSGQGGNCATTSPVPSPEFEGIDAMLFPGYGSQAPTVAALASDNVTGIDLQRGAASTSVPIVNNSAFVRLTGLTADTPLHLDVHYGNGACLTFPLINPLGDFRTVEELAAHPGC